MMISELLPAPKVVPSLDPGFRPSVLACQAFAREATVPVRVALEQSERSLFHFETRVLAPTHRWAAANAYFFERFAKFLLWNFGGWRFWVEGGPGELAKGLAEHYRSTEVGRFDSTILGERVYGHPIAVEQTVKLPAARSRAAALGRHLEGNRIGFDLGGSDRKVAAVREGKVVFSDETVWDPYFQKDPQYHFDGIMDSLRKAAAHLPSVDAIGGSAAGVYVDNEVKVASLFRGVSKDDFEKRVRPLFAEIRRAWNNVPFELVNDGEVTALAGSMSLGANSVYGLSMGTSTAGGYVDPEGNITDRLNEPAFAPVDYRPDGPVDEWSGDRGCGVQFFSQQAVNRLLGPAGIVCDAKLPFAEKLKEVQRLMLAGDERAERIYQTIGVYLGYGVAHWAEYYDIRHLLVLGRVTTGQGGTVILDWARKVLEAEFPALAKTLAFHMPDEKEKRHGQAIAAASLPRIPGR